MSEAQGSHGRVIVVRDGGAPVTGSPSTLLARTPSFEVRRLNLARGREIPTHHAPGEITVHCLEGRVAFTAGGTTHELSGGQMLILGAGEPHSLVGLEDSTVLVTKSLPGQVVELGA